MPGAKTCGSSPGGICPKYVILAPISTILGVAVGGTDVLVGDISVAVAGSGVGVATEAQLVSQLNKMTNMASCLMRSIISFFDYYDAGRQAGVQF
jgi:hypothetical protein